MDADRGPSSLLILCILSTLCCPTLAGGGAILAPQYANIGQSMAVAGSMPVGAAGFSSAAAYGPDFNPLLMGGNRGYPGIRARINMRAFEYASNMIAPVLNSEIKKARIPPISQCIPQVNGCVQIYNLYVSRYRCPQRVVLYPAAPNRVIMHVENLDIGVTGNLGGQITVLLPIALFGIVQLNMHQVTIDVDLAIDRTATGAPYLRVQGCTVNIGYADAYIEQGGLVGDIVNSQFRGRISSMVRQMVPGKICAQLPQIVNEKLNGRLGSLPQTIALTQMASMFGSALGLTPSAGSPPADWCAKSCPAQASQSAPVAVAPPISVGVSAPLPSTAPIAPEIPSNAYGSAQGPSHKVARAIPLYGFVNKHRRTARDTAAVSNSTLESMDPAFLEVERAALISSFDAALDFIGAPKFKAEQMLRKKRDTRLRPAPQGIYRSLVAPIYRKARGISAGVPTPILAPPPPVAGAPAPVLAPPPANACSACPAAGASDDPANLIRQMAAHLDLNKLNDMFLSVQLMNTYATNCDFTIDLVGEFSPYGQGGTPFGPFPVQFPTACDGHMAEFIVSDYTLNSLFYHMHRKGFISFRIGPDTPKIGELLKTTCSDDEDDELEDGPIELDEEEEVRRRMRRRHAVHDALHHIASHHVAKRAHSHVKRSHKKRGRRQDDGSSLADLGICFGDILPAVREKYPNQKISILVHTVRAPSVILSAAQGGMASIDLNADADIYIDGTNNKVGTITITSIVEITAQVAGNRITGHATITQLQLKDNTGSLGLPQDALDNLGNLGKELLQKLANDALAKGIVVNIPNTGALPFQVINPEIHIVEHGLYIGTDITINAAALGLTGSC